MPAKLQVGVTCTATIVLTEIEIRALDALIGYGFEPFLKVFYEKLGQSYMKPHAAGLQSLFDNIEENVRPAISEVDWHRKTLADAIRRALAEKKAL